MAVPTLHAAGTGASAAAATTTVTPAYPAVTNGDLLVLQVVLRSTPMDTVSTPSGWTSVYSDLGTGGDSKQQIFTKISDGTETGTLTVTVPGGNSTKQARIYSFSGTNGTIEGAALGQLNSTPIDFPSVTTAGADRLACALVCTRDTQALVSATGESGGDWTEAVAEYTPLASLQLQTANMVSAGTISAGSVTITAQPWLVRAFAIQPTASGGGGSNSARDLLLIGAG